MTPRFSFVLLRLYFLLPSLSGLFVLTPYLCYPSDLPISPVLVLSRQRDSLFIVKTARATLILVAISTGGSYGGVTLRSTLSKRCGAFVIILTFTIFPC